MKWVNIDYLHCEMTNDIKLIKWSDVHLEVYNAYDSFNMIQV